MLQPSGATAPSASGWVGLVVVLLYDALRWKDSIAQLMVFTVSTAYRLITQKMVILVVHAGHLLTCLIIMINALL